MFDLLIAPSSQELEPPRFPGRFSAGSISQATKELGLEHHAVLTSSGKHAVGAWHIQNVNAYHSRLKTWVRRFYGVATYHLENYLGWFRALDRMPRNPARPAQLLALALGR